MPTASLRSVTASLGLHVMLLAAAHDAVTAPPRQVPSSASARWESTIAVESLGAPGDGLSPPMAAAATPLRDVGSVAPLKVPPAVPQQRAPASPAPRSARVRVPSQAAPAPTPPPAASRVPAAPPGDGQAPEDALTAARGPAAGMSTSGGAPPPTDVTGSVVSGEGTAGSGVARNAPEGNAREGQARLLTSYLNGARERVARHREYPYLARRTNLEGTVCLRIVIAASGRVLGVTPTCGMAHQPLVEAALASVAKAAPFPPLPAPLGPRITFDVPVVFELEHL